MNIAKSVCFIILSFLFFFDSNAQIVESLDEVKNTFIAELQKSLPDGTKLNDKAFELKLVNKIVANNLGLEGKPRDAFFLVASKKNLIIQSFSVEGLQNGTFWYLHHLGYRYYFPISIWHHIPRISTPFKPIEKLGVPSFLHRRIWYAYGAGSKNADKNFDFWFKANLLGGVQVNAGHAYDGIVLRNQAIFLKHPEFFAQKVTQGQIPKNPKFEVSNEALVQLCIDDALKQIASFLAKTGNLPEMISMDPSDGGGFSTSTKSLKIGGPSEQVFFLANQVAKAVHKHYPGIKVGVYAYNFHAAPPSFAIEKNVTVLIATAYNRSKYPINELIKLWEQKHVQIGIRDYYGVLSWDWDMPGMVKGGQIKYILNLKNLYSEGIRLFTAESNIGWISRGLGHYTAARLLWDVEIDPTVISEEFFEKMFGNASNEIKNLFDSWQNFQRPVPLEGDLHDWFQILEEAEKRDINKVIQQRLMHIKQYLIYVNLFRKWRQSQTEDDLVQLLNFAYRVQQNEVVSSYPLFRTLASRSSYVKPDMRYNNPNAIWKIGSIEISEEETNRLFNEALSSFDPTQKTLKALLPEKLGSKKNKILLTNKSNKEVYGRFRGSHLIVFQLDGKNAEVHLYGGVVSSTQYKPLSFTVFLYKSDLSTVVGEPLLQRAIEPLTNSVISLNNLPFGTYIGVIDDANKGFKISFSGYIYYGFIAGYPNQIHTHGRNNFVLNVAGVKSFKIQNDGRMTVLSPKGRRIDLQNQPGLIRIDVKEGEDGLWQILHQSGKFQIQGISPLLGLQDGSLIQNDD